MFRRTFLFGSMAALALSVGPTTVRASVLTAGSVDTVTNEDSINNDQNTGAFTDGLNNGSIDSHYPSSQFPGEISNFFYSETVNNSGTRAFFYLGSIGGNTPGAVGVYEEGAVPTGDFNLRLDYSVFDVGSAQSFTDNTLRADVIEFDDTQTVNQAASNVRLDSLQTDQDFEEGVGRDLNANVTTLTLDSLIQSTNTTLNDQDFQTFTSSTPITLTGKDNVLVRLYATNINGRSGGNNREAVLVDNVDLVPVPEPASVLLMGLGGLLVVTRRHCRHCEG